MNLAKLVSASKFIIQAPTTIISVFGSQQVRNKIFDWRTIRDVKRRRMAAEAFNDRLRITSLKKNTILPIELREIAAKEIDAFPKNTTRYRIVSRCVITSRPRGVVYPWRMSRIVWRHLVDYNKMSGLQRAMW